MGEARGAMQRAAVGSGPEIEQFLDDMDAAAESRILFTTTTTSSAPCSPLSDHRNPPLQPVARCRPGGGKPS